MRHYWNQPLKPLIQKRIQRHSNFISTSRVIIQGGCCDLPFYMLELMPERWKLLDVLVWRYDISFDPGRGKYKPLYEWVIRVGYGDVDLPELGMLDWYIPILKGNSNERKKSPPSCYVSSRTG